MILFYVVQILVMLQVVDIGLGGVSRAYLLEVEVVFSDQVLFLLHEGVSKVQIRLSTWCG